MKTAGGSAESNSSRTRDLASQWLCLPFSAQHCIVNYLFDVFPKRELLVKSNNVWKILSQLIPNRTRSHSMKFAGCRIRQICAFINFCLSRNFVPCLSQLAEFFNGHFEVSGCRIRYGNISQGLFQEVDTVQTFGRRLCDRNRSARRIHNRQCILGTAFDGIENRLNLSSCSCGQSLPSIVDGLPECLHVIGCLSGETLKCESGDSAIEQFWNSDILRNPLVALLRGVDRFRILLFGGFAQIILNGRRFHCC